MNEGKVVEVWEAYKRDSQECVIGATKQIVENQSVFDEVDLICESKVLLSVEDIERLEKGEIIF